MKGIWAFMGRVLVGGSSRVRRDIGSRVDNGGRVSIREGDSKYPRKRLKDVL